MHLAMAVWAQRDSILDGVRTTLGKPYNMMTFEVTLVLVISKRSFLFAKIA